MSSIDTIASKLQSALLDKDGRTPKAYDTSAQVLRVEGDTLWVHIDGGVDETPVKRTINAAEGDTIQVHVANGGAWVTGNASNPPTDDRKANSAVELAATAQKNVEIVGKTALEARVYADQAKEAAEEAEAKTEEIRVLAVEAQESADNAYDSSLDARAFANEAFVQLGVVQNILGVIDLISKHGKYSDQPSSDTEVISGKWYFDKYYVLTNDVTPVDGKKYYTRSASEPYVYTLVENPVASDMGLYYEESYKLAEDRTGSPAERGWYELVDIDEAIQNYVSSHLILDQQGLWIQPTDGSYRLLLSPTQGMIIYGPNGEIASYGAKAIIGNRTLFHIEIDNNEIGFYRGTEKVAYMNGAELYVENRLSFGNFAFTQRQNGHFTLKLLGG